MLKQEADMSTSSLSQMLTKIWIHIPYAPPVRGFWKVKSVLSGRGKAVR